MRLEITNETLMSLYRIGFTPKERRNLLRDIIMNAVINDFEAAADFEVDVIVHNPTYEQLEELSRIDNGSITR